MKPVTRVVEIPPKASERARALAMAGFGKDMDPVNQLAAVLQIWFLTEIRPENQ